MALAAMGSLAGVRRRHPAAMGSGSLAGAGCLASFRQPGRSAAGVVNVGGLPPDGAENRWRRRASAAQVLRPFCFWAFAIGMEMALSP